MHRTANPENPTKTLPRAQPPALEPPLPIQTPQHKRVQNARNTQIGTSNPGPAARDPATTRRSGAAREHEPRGDAPGWLDGADRVGTARGLAAGGDGVLALALDRSAAGAPRQAASTRPHKRSEVGIGEWRREAAAKYCPTPLRLRRGQVRFCPPRRGPLNATALHVGRGAEEVWGSRGVS
jgi:hypothetical protein